MFVRDYMTRDPVTVRPESDPLAAVALLKCGGFRRLPVVDADDRLVGIVDRDGLDLFLAKAGSPGVLKRRHRVDQVMNHEVVTVAPDCPLEEAASLMVGHKIGSLPVMEEGQVVGIITETDIFKQFAGVLGGGTGSLRLTVQVRHLPGQLAELASRIARVDGNISSIVAHGADRGGRINITLRVQGAGQEKVLDAISGQAGLQVLHVWGAEGSGHPCQ
jgi:acetoin utilization protein AcuB